MSLLALTLTLFSLALPATSISQYAVCQSTLGKIISPTAGCPPGTRYVSQTDKRAKYKTVQQAVLSLPNDASPQWILVGSGLYKDAVNVTRVGPTTILGQTNAPDSYHGNLVTVYNTTYINQAVQNASIQDNADSQVLTVAPNKYSVWTGAGYYGATPQPIPIEYGSTDFRSYNINWENRAANESVGPALALGVGFANASFYGCSFKSWQDTVFVGKNASVVFKKSEVLGRTDYVYGFGTAYFVESVLGSRAPGCLTAWKGNPDYPNTYGVYFSKSSIVQAPAPYVDTSFNLTGTHCLGRPWNNASRVVFMDSYMDSSVLPEGFTIWGTTDPRMSPNLTYYAEYNNYGPGSNSSVTRLSNGTRTRVSFDRQLSTQESRQWSLEKVFGGKPKWYDTLY